MIKKYLFVYFLLFFNDLISQSLPIENECFIPSYEESIVTGSNMTIFFSPEAYSNFPDLNDEAFVIALGTDSNLLIGSQYVNTNENQTDENQFAISISGDDSTTDEIDGAISNEVIILQLINAGTLYNITLDSQIVYMTNGLLTLNNFSLDELSCNLIGCTDSLAINFDQYANVDDGSCIDVVEGCTQSDAFNFNSSANVDDGSCIDVVEGCTNPGVGNYDPAANTDDGSCITPALCFTVDPDFPCETITSNNMSVLFPASNPVLWNDFESNVEVNDQIAAFYVTGTLINAFLGYSANSSLGNAGGFVWSGSQADVAIFGADVNGGNGFQPGEELLWLVLRAGVVHEATVTYATPNYDGTYQEGSFVTVNSIVVGGQLLEGCMNSNYMEYDPMATSSNPNDCMTLISVGCLDDNSPNYAGADLDVDSIHPYANNYGDAFGENYMIDLNTGLPNAPSGVPAIFSDTSACQPSIIIGCMDPSACSYDPAANVYDPASCSGVSGCTDANYLEFDPSANCDDGSCSELVVLGCTDAEASNYNIDANLDDGSCEYTELVCSNPIALNFNEFDYCNYNISDIDTLTACGGILYDSGGPDGSYISNENHSITIYPENQGEYVSLFFSSFELESCCDYLTIYDGVGNSSPVLQIGSNGTSLNGLTFYASPTNESGALTITFTTDGSITYPGFSAEIGCTTYGPCFGFDVNVLSTFESEEGAGDASASLDIILGNEPFEILWSTGDTTSSINDLSAGNYSVSITDGLECFTETNFEIVVDPLEYLISDIDTLTACGGILYDSGGPDGSYINNENHSITIYPENQGEYVSLFFSSFQLESCCDYLTIYDGVGVSSPVLQTGSNGSSLNGLTFYASPTNESGALTITFTTDGSVTYPGFSAEIGCTTYGPCFGFDVNVLSTFESEEGASDASASLDIILGNEPFDILWSTGDTTSSINDLSAGTYSVSITDSLECFTETNFEILVDPEEYLMGDITNISSCNGIFYDSGGPDSNFGLNENFFTRICPDEDGLSSQLIFNEFSISSGQFTVYDGFGISSPIIASGSFSDFIGDTLTASIANSTGCLAITFSSSTWFTTSGWEASISCYDHIIYGCTDSLAFNFLVENEVDDGSCYYSPGCTDSLYIEYYTQGFIADFNDGSCIQNLIDDCLDSLAINYNPQATFNIESDPCVYNYDDWECGMNYVDFRDQFSYNSVQIGNQCWITENIRFKNNQSTQTSVNFGGVVSQMGLGFVYTGEEDYNYQDNGRYYTWTAAELAVPFGWHLPTIQEVDTLILNYSNSDLIIGGISGFESILSGGILLTDNNYEYYGVGLINAFWTSDDFSEIEANCLVIDANPLSNPQIVPFPKTTAISVRAIFGFPENAILGCTDEDYIEYDIEANYDDGTCETLIVLGCTDSLSINYNYNATLNDGSCVPIVEGCMNDIYVEFDPLANVDNGSCLTTAIFGCTDEFAFNFDSIANLDDNSCIPVIEGCMDPNFIEFNFEVNMDNGTCLTEVVLGCTDSESFNYNLMANTDDNSCIPFIYGCTDSLYIEFNFQANTEDGSCLNFVIYGCTIDYAENYDFLANTNDGSCIIYGCTNDLFLEYDPNATLSDSSCMIYAIPGCMDNSYLEYYPPANIDDGSCQNIIVMGCTNSNYLEYFSEANTDDGSCQTLSIVGCTDPSYIEFNPIATVDINSCVTPIIYGCTNENYIEFNIEANQNDGSCSNIIIEGCMDSNFIEFDPEANQNDGSCLNIILEGCMDENYLEYNPNVNFDNGTCLTEIVLGCNDILAINFDPNVNVNDGSCIPLIVGCTDSLFLEFNPNANTSDLSQCNEIAIPGCIDSSAVNYNSNSNLDDGSCFYYLVEFSYVMYADGVCAFTPVILGMGTDFQVYWDFGDGSYSNELNPIHSYSENGLLNVTLNVYNGSIDSYSSQNLEIISVLNIGDIDLDLSMKERKYFDILGREVKINNLSLYQIYIVKDFYKDGKVKSYLFFKN